MRTDRSRINASTQLLLDLEEQLLEADRTSAKKDLPTIFKKIYSLIDRYHHVRTSREVDQFLQLSMIYISARLHFHFRDTRKTEFKVSTSVYDSRHELFVVQPSYFFPGRCSILNTTILLTRDEEEGGPEEAVLYGPGLSGLTLSSGEVLHCTKLQGENRCPAYVRLESRSLSALSIPLRVGLAGALDRFQRAKAPNSGSGPHCCDCHESVHSFSRRKSDAPTYGVLNIDCNTDELQIQKAKKIIGDSEVRSVLNIMVNRLAEHQADRAAYSVLRNCTALLELSQHTLEARHAHVALLREISAICDGADVTLHLRDMFSEKDRDRSVKLIAGVGPRFRGFLIGERYGDGLVGEAMAGIGQFRSRDREEIKSSFTGKHDYSYRRLMPGTELNAAVPIRFHSRVIGAINIEWDKRQVSGMNSEETDRYLDIRQMALERLANYFALVIDYFDDRENESLKPPHERKHQESHVRKATSRRRVLAYYANSALQRVDEAERNGQIPWNPDLEQILCDLIDAVGYFLTFESKHRILASVRRREHRSNGDTLDLVYAHGFDPKTDDELGPGGPIPIVAGQSVLGTCAVLGVAIFGRIEDGLLLRPDPLCESFAPEEDREILGRPIHYKAAGHQPVYEVGVPLVFGGDILGTFDFELFSLTRSERSGTPEENGDSPLALAGHELAPFLEWARAITFCMAYAEDSPGPGSATAALNTEQRAAFRRFQRLCAQIVANVAIPQDLLTSIAGEHLRGLIPLRELELLPATSGSGGEVESSVTAPLPESGSGDTRERALWWRGERLGTIRMILDSESSSLQSVFPDISPPTGTSILAQRFIAAFCTAALSAERSSEFDSREFKNALASVQSAFSDKVESFKNNAETLARLDPYALIEIFFSLLNQALQRLLLTGDDGSKVRQTCRHGWFLYLAQCIEDQDLGERAVLRSGKPFARWVSMSTPEMKSLISRVLESQDPKKTLGEILGPAFAEEILLAAPRADFRSVDKLEELFVEALARRGRDYPDPDPRRDQGPSLTAATVRQKRVRSDIDLNRNPVRSWRKSEWFFGDKPYSIIGVPILLGKRVIGILQIFRRRDAIDDVLFFKNDEIRTVALLGKMLEAVIATEIECLAIPVVQATATTVSFTREVTALGARLKERINRRQVPLIVSCDFLAEPASCERFLDYYVGHERTTFTTHELLKLETIEIEQMDNLSVVCVLYSQTGERPCAELRERMAALAGASTVILLISRDDERTTLDLLPDSFFERQRRDDPAEVLRFAFGSAEGQEGHNREEIGILIRKSGTWTIGRMVEDCGNEAGVIRNNAKIILQDMKERQNVSRRLFPDWYQAIE